MKQKKQDSKTAAAELKLAETRKLTERNGPRKLDSIYIERRFGGFVGVLKFTDGTLEATSQKMLKTTSEALRVAEAWIAVPGYNIKWWTDCK